MGIIRWLIATDIYGEPQCHQRRQSTQLAVVPIDWATQTAGLDSQPSPYTKVWIDDRTSTPSSGPLGTWCLYIKTTFPQLQQSTPPKKPLLNHHLQQPTPPTTPPIPHLTMKLPLPLLALPALSSALPQTNSTPPPSFRITSVISGDTGCPRGSIDVKWTDTRILPISYISPPPPPATLIHRLTLPEFGPEFTAAVGPNADITDSHKNCQLNLKLEYDAGYSFAVYSAEYTGFAELEAGVQGSVKSSYYFSGAGEQVRNSLLSFCTVSSFHSFVVLSGRFDTVLS